MRMGRLALVARTLAAVGLMACGAQGGAGPLPGAAPRQFADPGGSGTARTMDPDRRRHLLRIMPAVSSYLSGQREQFELPGIVAGFVAGGELFWAETQGVRDLESGAIVELDTVFRIGSITKTFTGMAVLQLRDAGRLELSDAAEQYLPQLRSLRYPTADSPRISLRHLLTHTSGIGLRTQVDYWRRPRALTERELFRTLDGFALEDVPGTTTNYSNIGVGLAGLIVSRVAGQPLRDYVDQHILDPLGMKATVWDRELVPPEKLATGYQRTSDGSRKRGHHWRLGAIEGMGGLYSTLPDLARYVAFELSAWPPRGGPDDGPLARSSVRESQLPAGPSLPGRDRQTYGIGWRVRYERDLGHVVSHVGGTLQYSAAIWMLPERDLGLIILCNDGYGLDKLDTLARNAMWIAVMHETGRDYGIIETPEE